jgi:hypothetical protein
VSKFEHISNTGEKILLGTKGKSKI